MSVERILIAYCPGFMQVLLTGRYPLQERERSHYFFLYGGRKGVFQSGRGAGQILTPDMSTCAAIYEAVQGVEKGMISATANSAEENQIFYILYPATTLEEAYEISDVLYPGMLGK